MTAKQLKARPFIGCRSLFWVDGPKGLSPAEVLSAEKLPVIGRDCDSMHACRVDDNRWRVEAFGLRPDWKMPLG